MSGLIMFGVDVEKTYGTAFYAMIHIGLIVFSNLMFFMFSTLMVFAIPHSLRGGPDNFFNCAVGYSNVLFGISIIFSFIGEKNANFLGLCHFDKKYIPWFYMILIYATIPNSSFIGHFFGIVTGLMIKFCGLYIFFPKYDWIQEFDAKYAD
jgi:hypothetical protein